MGTIKIGSSANKKGITINPSIVLFNGSNVKKIMRGAVTVWENLKPLVPIMTSNTTPSGKASASSSHSSNPVYYLFDGNNTTTWRVSTSVVVGASGSGYAQYDFDNPVLVKSVYMEHVEASCTTKIEVSGSNNGSDFVTIKDFTYNTTEKDPATRTLDLSDNNNVYISIRVKFTQTNKHTANAYLPQLYTLQFYGRQLEALVPTMTSNTTPSGEVIYDGGTLQDVTTYPLYNAFDGNYSTRASIKRVDGTTYLGYKFATSSNIIKGVILVHETGCTYKIQFSNNVDFATIGYEKEITTSVTDSPEFFDCSDNFNSYEYARILFISRTNTSSSWISIRELQFYG